MISVTVVAESIDTSGALAIVHAASDELQQRYGGDGDNAHLNVDELRPPLGLFLVARHERQPRGRRRSAFDLLTRRSTSPR